MKKSILQILAALSLVFLVLPAWSSTSPDFLYEQKPFTNINPADPDTLWRGLMTFALPKDWATRTDLQNHFFADLKLGRFDLRQKIIDHPLEEWQITEKQIRISVRAVPLNRFPIAEHLIELDFPEGFPINKMIVFPKVADWGGTTLYTSEPPPPVRYFAIFDKESSIFMEGHPEKGLDLGQRGVFAPTAVRTLILRDWLGTTVQKDIEIERPTPHFRRPYFWFGSVLSGMSPLSADSLQQKIAQLRTCPSLLTNEVQTNKTRRD